MGFSPKATNSAATSRNHNDKHTPPRNDDHFDTFQNSLLFNRHLSSQDPEDDPKHTLRMKRKPRKKVRLEHPITGEVIYDFVETEQEKQEKIQRGKDLARALIRRNARIQYDLRGEQDIAGAIHYLVCSTTSTTSTSRRHSKSETNEQGNCNVVLNQEFIHAIENLSSSDSSSLNDSLDDQDSNDDNDGGDDNDPSSHSEKNQNDKEENDNHNPHLHQRASFHTSNPKELQKKDPSSAPLLPYQLEGLMAPTNNKFDYSKLLKKHKLDVGPWNDVSGCEENAKYLDDLQRIRGIHGLWSEAKPQLHLQITKRPNLEMLTKSIISSSKIGKLSDNKHDYHCQSLIFKSGIAKYFLNELSHVHTLFFQSKERNLGQYLDALTCTLSSADSRQIILRTCYEFATNLELWNEINPRVQSLRHASMGLLSRQEYMLFRHELLSGNGQSITGYDNEEIFSNLHLRLVGWRNFVLKCLDCKEKEANLKTVKGGREGTRDMDCEYIPNYENRCGQLYDKVIHESSIDIDSMNLILAIMYGLVCGRLTDVSSRSQSDQKTIATLIRKTRLDMEQFLDHLIKIGCRDESFDTNPLRKNLSSGPLAHAILHRQSNIANTRTELLEVKLAKHEFQNSNYQDVSKKMVLHGQVYLKDTRVRIFHRIHMTTAIATLTQHLPSYAIKVLKRPVFDGSLKEATPFDLVRKALSKMEQKEDIKHGFQNSYSVSSSEVHVNELIRYFQESADIFGSLLNYEHDDLFECRCWYTAVLVGLLCLASGVHIGQEVSPALPPAKDNMLRLSQSDQQRLRHKEYCTIRLQCVRAVGSFLMIREREKGTSIVYKFHLSTKALLEWKQASCLLAMRPYLNSSDAFYKLKCLHASHCYDLARREVSPQYFPVILDLCSKQLISKRELLSLLVLSIDKKPSDAENWYRLAGFLYATKDCHIHDMYHNRWGERYASLWSEEGLFAFPSCVLYSEPKTSSKQEMIRILEKEASAYSAIGKAIPSFEKSRLVSCNESFFARINHEISRDVSNLEWMWPRDEPCFDDAEDYLDLVDEDSGKYVSFEKDVPSISSSFKGFDMMGSLINLKPPIRLIMSKIMVACYFNRGLGVNDDTMLRATRAIRFMVQLCIQNNGMIDTKRSEFMSLCMLENLTWSRIKITSLVKEWQNDREREILNLQKRRSTNSTMSSWMDQNHLCSF